MNPAENKSLLACTWAGGGNCDNSVEWISGEGDVAYLCNQHREELAALGQLRAPVRRIVS